MKDCEIEDEGAAGIFAALRKNNKEYHAKDIAGPAFELVNDAEVFATLDLRCSNISDGGVEAIAETIEVNGLLKDLNLSHNNIKSEGARARAESLMGIQYFLN